MHPDVTADVAGRCSKCGMQLISGNPFDTREYSLEFDSFPSAAEAAVPVTLRFVVRDPATGNVVREYERVHDKEYHLFVVSQDLSVFFHVHPVLLGDGAWEVQLVLPKEGYYRVLSDFVPKGGSPQLLARSLVTIGYEGDVFTDAPPSQPDASTVVTVDGIRAELAIDPQPLLAGQFGHLSFTLRDAQSGELIDDLQPYLGAFGHTLIMSADMLDAVHSHPSEGPEHDITKGVGGPMITFEGYLPRPGIYRAWTQFQRHGRLSTVTSTFRVLSVEGAFSANVCEVPDARDDEWLGSLSKKLGVGARVEDGPSAYAWAAGRAGLQR
jgi:hypothetical protein